MKKSIFYLYLIFVIAIFCSCSINYSSDDSSIPSLITLSEDEPALPSVSEDVIINEPEETVSSNIVINDLITPDSININENILNNAYKLGNLSRLAHVMEKAANGEEITICYLGGSITNGSLAEPKEDHCYAYLSTQWWIDTFPNAKINYINAGIGGTDSYLGLSRVDNDVLQYNPDLVIVEFSVNDKYEWNKETYESLLRNILLSDSEPAVIALLLTTADLQDMSYNHSEIASYYSVPVISYSNFLNDSICQGYISWDQVGNEDGIHPNNGGHAVIAYMLNNFLQKVVLNMEEYLSEEYYVANETITACRYENSHLIYADELNITNNIGFTSSDMGYYIPSAKGFTTDSNGSISFNITGKVISLFYIESIDESFGSFDVYVDGQLNNTINAYRANNPSDQIEYIIISKDTVSKEHQIDIVPADNSAGNKFILIGVSVSQ